MADRRMFGLGTMSPQCKELEGTFTVSGTADPTSATGCARGVTVTRTAVGKYKIAWSDTYKRLIGFSCEMTHDSSTTAQSKKDVRGGKLAFSSNYVEIRLRSAGHSLTNPSTGTAIFWRLKFEDGNV